MDEKSEIINQLMQKYWEEFSSSSSWDLPMSLSDLTEEQKSIYRDRVI
jgi:tRNA uridine 5-carbamoylmethylation protein Kti12